MKQHIEQGQTLLDALVQHTGSIDNLFDFLRLNNKNNLQFDPTGEMQFPEIAKKTVVQQLQALGIAPATADTQIYPLPTEWQSETVAFMETAGIPNDETILYLGTAQQTTGVFLWYLVDWLVVKLKGYGVWKYLHAFYPFIGGTAKSHAVNLVKPGAFNIEWSSAVRHSPYGVFFDGVSAYGKTNFYTSYFQPKSLSVFYYNRNDKGSGILCGSHDRLSPNGSVTILVDTKAVYNWLNSSSYVGTPLKGLKGFFVHTREDEKVVSIYKRSSKESLSNKYTALVNPTLYFEEIYVGAANNNNVPEFFSTAQPSAIGFGMGLNSKQVDILNEVITTFQKQLNRNA